MSNQTPHIAVYGATGRTGRLVAAELARRDRDFVTSGRSLEKLQTLSAELGDEFGVVPTIRQASVDHSRELDTVLRDVSVLINCAGPFTELGRPVARAAVRNGAHYLDTTGEQGYIRWVDEELALRADNQGVAVMPGCAFEYATGSIVGRVAVERGADRVVVAYGVSGMQPSAGTKKSILRSVSEEGCTFRNGVLVPDPPASETYEVPRPEGTPRPALGFPGGEAIFVPKFGEVELAGSCMVVDETTARLLGKLSAVLPAIAGAVTPAADRIFEWLRRAAGEHGDGEDAPFQVVAFDPKEDEWFAAVSGRGPYPTTSRIIVESATRLHDDSPESVATGFQTPASIWEAAPFAEAVGLELLTAPE